MDDDGFLAITYIFFSVVDKIFLKSQPILIYVSADLYKSCASIWHVKYAEKYCVIIENQHRFYHVFDEHFVGSNLMCNGRRIMFLGSINNLIFTFIFA